MKYLKAKIRLIVRMKKEGTHFKMVSYFYITIQFMASSFESYQKRRLITSYLSVTVSIALVLFVLGMFGLLALNTQKVANHFKEQIALTVYLKDSAKEIEITQLQKKLALADYTKSATFVSKQDAAEQHSEEIGENYMDFLGYNPLQNSIDVFLNAAYVDSESIQIISNELSAKNFVESVSYDRPLISLLNDNIRRISFWILVISGGFLVISILLINSSIRLAIYSKRMIIKTMQMVGATKRFIRRPFVWTHMQLGILGALLAIAGIVAMIEYVSRLFPQLDLKYDYPMLGMLFGSILLIGIVITAISTFFATQRYLNLKTDRLY